jgi:L-iditol 2-dehydrogenase
MLLLRRGQQNLCEDLLFNNGAYAEYCGFRRGSWRRIRCGSGARAARACRADRAAGLRGARARGERRAAGDTMIVIGAGPIGLMFMHAGGAAASM